LNGYRNWIAGRERSLERLVQHRFEVIRRLGGCFLYVAELAVHACSVAAGTTQTRRFRYSIFGVRGCLSGRGSARRATIFGSGCTVPAERRWIYR
jgi:hypothetical protein